MSFRGLEVRSGCNLIVFFAFWSLLFGDGYSLEVGLCVFVCSFYILRAVWLFWIFYFFSLVWGIEFGIGVGV